jgi:hypothetical protein
LRNCILMSTYESIPMVSPLPEGTTAVPPPRRSVWIAGLAIMGTIALMLVGSSKSHNSNTASSSSMMLDDLSMLGATEVASCTFNECFSSNCNHDVAPFTCLRNNGGPHGGCSPTPWIEGTCEKQCDLSGCDQLPMPDDVEDCDVQCDEEWCDGAGERLCPSPVSYQCSVGSAAYGCSDDKLEWTLRTSSATCSSCCNADLC